jgi:hypothetical protein
VFEAGRIVERGSFAELLARGGAFAHLVATQLDPLQAAPPALATSVKAYHATALAMPVNKAMPPNARNSLALMPRAALPSCLRAAGTDLAVRASS